MSAPQETAQQWTCDQCGLSAGRIDGARAAIPDTWESSTEGRFCLICRRDRAASAAVDAAPRDLPRNDRAELRRAALIEFEVRREPERPNNAIAKACRSSAVAVAAARQRLHMPDPPRTSASKRGIDRRVPSR
jgi:thioredoxin-like negative regulator of GroEL